MRTNTIQNVTARNSTCLHMKNALLKPVTQNIVYVISRGNKGANLTLFLFQTSHCFLAMAIKRNICFTVNGARNRQSLIQSEIFQSLFILSFKTCKLQHHVDL